MVTSTDRDHIQEHIRVQLELLYDSIAEEFELETGDVSPWEMLKLSKIEDQLEELLIEYLENNRR